MRRKIILLGLLAVGMAASPAPAVICTIDQVPSATLLVPYFEVDLDHVDGPTTLISINNGSAEAVLTHVVLWTDLSVETFSFHVYLTGFDMQSFNLRDVFNGIVPRTASVGQDPTDIISPRGGFSQDVNFASCAGQLPPPNVPAVLVDHLRRAHTGQASTVFQNRCSGVSYGDNVARGYVTVDTVNNCTLQSVGTANSPYFSSSITFQNVLWGDVIYIRPSAGLAEGASVVNIEASFDKAGALRPGSYTFYGRYVNWLATDRREPLPTTFFSRFLVVSPSTSTDLLCWRDSKVVQGPFTCPAFSNIRPPWYPLGQEAIVVFDEQETAEEVVQLPQSPPQVGGAVTPCPAGTQRTQVDGPGFPVTPNIGGLLLKLNTTVTAAGANPPGDPTVAQAWVTTVLFDGSGRYSVGYDATQLDSACKSRHFIPGS